MAVGGLILGITAIFLPPLPVFWRRGCGSDLLIDIVLLFLGWIPGILYAWFIILDSPNMRQRHRNKKERRRSQVFYARSPVRRGGRADSWTSVEDRKYVRRGSRSRSRGARDGYYREEVYPPAIGREEYHPPPSATYYPSSIERGARRKY